MSEYKKMASAVVKDAIKDKSVWDKLFYWAIFKITYNVGFVYYFLKGVILRRW
jgi:hypothetical protein